MPIRCKPLALTAYLLLSVALPLHSQSPTESPARHSPKENLSLPAGSFLRLQRTQADGSCRSSPLAFSPDGKVLAQVDEDGVSLWQSVTGKKGQVLHGHQGPVVSLRFSLDAGILASGGQDRTVRTWDVKTGKELYRFEGPKGAVS